jgi:hypothetical protein
LLLVTGATRDDDAGILVRLYGARVFFVLRQFTLKYELTKKKLFPQRFTALAQLQSAGSQQAETASSRRQK